MHNTFISMLFLDTVVPTPGNHFLLQGLPPMVWHNTTAHANKLGQGTRSSLGKIRLRSKTKAVFILKIKKLDLGRREISAGKGACRKEKTPAVFLQHKLQCSCDFCKRIFSFTGQLVWSRNFWGNIWLHKINLHFHKIIFMNYIGLSSIMMLNSRRFVLISHRFKGGWFPGSRSFTSNFLRFFWVTALEDTVRYFWHPSPWP